jgi:hypothetical protein
MASKARSHVKGSCLRPPPYTSIKWPLTWRGEQLNRSLPPLYSHFMAGFYLHFVCPCAGFNWHPSWQPPSEFFGICRLITALVWLQASFHSPLHLTLSIQFTTRTMPRPRGRPRRGSPWKPRRPSVSPPASPSSCSSPSIQPEPTLPSSPALAASHFDSLAIVPRLSSSTSRHLPEPPLFEPPLAPIPTSVGLIVGEPPPCKPRSTENQSPNSFPDTQLRESLAILFGLVFELRQGVEDLQFRLLAVDGKIAVLLQLLTSLQEAIPSDLAGEATAAEPGGATNEGNVQEQNSARNEQHEVRHEEKAKEMDTGRDAKQDTPPAVGRTEGSVDAVKQWADQVTYVEEEPWSEAVHVTWPGYPPHV